MHVYAHCSLGLSEVRRDQLCILYFQSWILLLYLKIPWAHWLNIRGIMDFDILDIGLVISSLFFFLFSSCCLLKCANFYASMKNMEKILFTCWMVCSPLCFLIPVTKVLLLLGMLLVLHPFIWAGVLMVWHSYCILYLVHTFALLWFSCSYNRLMEAHNQV